MPMGRGQGIVVPTVRYYLYSYILDHATCLFITFFHGIMLFLKQLSNGFSAFHKLFRPLDHSLNCQMLLQAHVQLRTEVLSTQSSNSRPPDHDSTFHVTETPALTTQPSVTIWTCFFCAKLSAIYVKFMDQCGCLSQQRGQSVRGDLSIGRSFYSQKVQ